MKCSPWYSTCFCELNASDDQLDFPWCYQRQDGYAKLDITSSQTAWNHSSRGRSMSPAHGRCQCPVPDADCNTITTTYSGAWRQAVFLTGKVRRRAVAMIKADEQSLKWRHHQTARLRRAEAGDIEEAGTGDIVTVAGFEVSASARRGFGETPLPYPTSHRRADPVDELHCQHLPFCRS